MKATLIEFDKNHYSHLDDCELNLIKDRINKKQSFSFQFEDEKSLFHVIIDIDSESVHVRHIGGRFAFKWRYIYNLCTIIARRINLNKITVIADKNFMIYAVKKLGFNKVNDTFYERIIT